MPKSYEERAAFRTSALAAASKFPSLAEDIQLAKKFSEQVDDLDFANGLYSGTPAQLAERINKVVAGANSLLERFKKAKFISPEQQPLKQAIISLHAMVQDALDEMMERCFSRAMFNPAIISEFIKQNNTYITDIFLRKIGDREASQRIQSNTDECYIQAGLGLGAQKHLLGKRKSSGAKSLGEIIASNAAEIEELNSAVDKLKYQYAVVAADMNGAFIACLSLLEKLAQQDTLLRDEDPASLPLALKLHEVMQRTVKTLHDACCEKALHNESLARELLSKGHPALIKQLAHSMTRELKFEFSDFNSAIALFALMKMQSGTFSQLAERAEKLYQYYRDAALQTLSASELNDLYRAINALKTDIMTISLEEKNDDRIRLLKQMRAFAMQFPKEMCASLSHDKVFAVGSVELKVDYLTAMPAGSKNFIGLLQQHGSPKIKSALEHALVPADIVKSFEEGDLNGNPSEIGNKLAQAYHELQRILVQLEALKLEAAAEKDPLNALMADKLKHIVKPIVDNLISTMLRLVEDSLDHVAVVITALHAGDPLFRAALVDAILQIPLNTRENIYLFIDTVAEQETASLTAHAVTMKNIMGNMLELESETHKLQLPTNHENKTISADKAVALINQLFLQITKFHEALAAHHSASDTERKMIEKLKQLNPAIDKIISIFVDAVMADRKLEVALQATGGRAVNLALQEPLLVKKKAAAATAGQSLQQFDLSRDAVVVKEKEEYAEFRRSAGALPSR